MSTDAPYAVLIKRGAEKELDGLSEKIHDRIARAILALEADPRPRGCKKLAGLDQYRIRVGDYRILYVVDDVERRVEIVAVGHRRDVYDAR